VIAIDYLEIMWQKVIKKKIVEHFKEVKRKEKEEQKDRWTTKLMNAIERTIEEQVERQTKYPLTKLVIDLIYLRI
jgi:hypothetical protein